MCVAVPMKIVSITGDRGLALVGEVEREVGLALVPEVKVGEYVIVHAGYAISSLDEEEALETLAILERMGILEAEGAREVSE